MNPVGAVSSLFGGGQPQTVEEVVDKGIMDIGLSLFRQMIHQFEKNEKELENETSD